MKRYFHFGETIPGYEIPVLNEREARAAAGILLLPAVSSFFLSYLTHDFRFTKLFVTLFMIDFFIRIVINPKYAPSMIIGRIFVGNQIPEYVGAVQKRFAWSLGFMLSVIMFLIIVIFEIMTPVKIAICLLCILLLFSETAFGICLGCILYQKIIGKQAQYCPGNSCEVKKKKSYAKVTAVELFVLILFITGIYIYMQTTVNNMENKTTMSMKCASGKCGGK